MKSLMSMFFLSFYLTFFFAFAYKFKTIRPGTLTVCSDITYPPFEYIENGEIKGFDIDLFNKIAENLGYKVVYLNTAWDGIIPALLTHKCDLIISAMTITPERAKKVDFSIPYFKASQTVLVRKDSNIKSLADLKGKRVGVQIGTTGDIYAKKLQKKYPFILKTYETGPDAIMDLRLGRLDAVIIDNVVAYTAAKKYPNLKVAIDGLSNEYYGIAINKDNKNLKKAIDETLKKMYKNGEYDRIYESWFGKKPTWYYEVIEDLK